MKEDFIFAIFLGWLILVIFWFSTLMFIYIRKPPQSKLTKNFIIYSAIAFFIIFLFIWIIWVSDSFLR